MIREVSGWQIYSALFLIYYLYFMCVLGVCFLFSGQAVLLAGSQFPTQGSNMCSLHQGLGVLTTGPSGKFLTCAFCLQEIIKFFTDNFFKGNFGFPNSSVGKESACSAGDIGDANSISGLGRFPGGGNGNPLQYSCLENPMDRGALWAAYSPLVAKGQTRLSN